LILWRLLVELADTPEGTWLQDRLSESGMHNIRSAFYICSFH
jgi:hypothetical protein